jgi:hypothetical protein
MREPVTTTSESVSSAAGLVDSADMAPDAQAVATAIATAPLRNITRRPGWATVGTEVFIIGSPVGFYRLSN